MSTTTLQPAEGSPIVQRIAREHEQFLERLNGHRGNQLTALRLRAMEEFRRLGVPTVRHEEWKYTNLYSLLAKNFSLAAEPTTSETFEDVINPYTQWGDVFHFVNGSFCGAPTAAVQSLRSSLEHDEGLQEKIGTLASVDGNAIVAWNTAYLRDGAAIRLGDGIQHERALVLVSLLDGRKEHVLAHERHTIEVGRNSSLTLILAQRSIGDGHVLLNQVLEGWVDEGATLRIILVQDASANNHAITSHVVQLARSAQLHMTTISIGGGFIRNMPTVRLAGEGADAHLYGLTLADGTMLVDHHTTVDHAVPNCTSNELYKAILDGRSTGVFNGKIIVRPDAQKTSAYQANRNIVLSPRATINTKPQLEIFANDVRCTHGCTVGRIDKEAMFYLRSRGLSKQEAEALLLAAFAEEITATIPHEDVRIALNSRIEHLLHADELA
jgi:Fe-S cluster assembly protein SufD